MGSQARKCGRRCLYMPSWEAVFWPASALLLCYLVAANAASYWRLRHIPGPALGAVSYLWLVRHIVAGRTALAVCSPAP